MMAKTRIIKPQEPEKEIPTEVLAQSILEISLGVKKLLDGRLNERALNVLLREATGVGIAEIKKVLDALEHLDQRYLKPSKKITDPNWHMLNDR